MSRDRYDYAKDIIDGDGNISGAADISLTGDITLTGGGTIATDGATSIVLKPGGAAPTVVGDAGSTSHTLNANDDLFVSGDQEVDGTLYADGAVYVAGTLYANGHLLPPTVTYSTNMNTDVAGTAPEIVYCSTDSKAYICTTTGAVGSAVWAALN